MRHPVETLWREVGLPEYFLGNDGSNHKLYALYEAIVEKCAGKVVGCGECNCPAMSRTAIRALADVGGSSKP